MITGLSDGVSELLYRPHSTDTAVRPTGDSYSLGLARQTEVVALPPSTQGRLRPTLGLPRLAQGGNPRLAVANDEDNANPQYTLTIDVENAQSMPRPTAVFVGGAAVGTTPTVMLSGDRRSLTVTFRASTPTEVVSLRVTVYGSGEASASADYSWPVVPISDPLAMLPAPDADGDGILDAPDMQAGLSQSPILPVLVDDRMGGMAGAFPGHHIRPVLPRPLRLGLLARTRAGGSMQYADYSASTGTGSSITYNFEAYGVDYAADGGGGNVILTIPLPFSLYDGEGIDSGWVPVKIGADGTERPFNRLPEHGGYGFAPPIGDPADGPADGCPADTLDGSSPYRNADGDLKNMPKAANDACLAVWIVDGGDNDEDGGVNGIVHDPIGFARASGTPGGGSSGGSFGLFGIALLMLAMAATLLRRRRHARQ